MKALNDRLDNTLAVDHGLHGPGIEDVRHVCALECTTTYSHEHDEDTSIANRLTCYQITFCEQRRNRDARIRTNPSYLGLSHFVSEAGGHHLDSSATVSSVTMAENRQFFSCEEPDYDDDCSEGTCFVAVKSALPVPGENARPTFAPSTEDLDLAIMWHGKS